MKNPIDKLRTEVEERSKDLKTFEKAGDDLIAALKESIPIGGLSSTSLVGF